jgi:hypothetical protein
MRGRRLTSVFELPLVVGLGDGVTVCARMVKNIGAPRKKARPLRAKSRPNHRSGP